MWFQVLFHSPRRGSFHLSLTVLVHYRSQSVFSLAGWSRQIPAGFHVSRGTQDSTRETRAFAYGAITLSGRPFQTARLTLTFPHRGPSTPNSPFGSSGLGFSGFARHYFRNHGCFLFLWVLRWFTSPGLPRCPMYSDNDDRCSHRPGFPIRISPDHSLLAAPRGFSQLTTSFFAQLRLGIHTHALSSLTIKSTRHTFVSHRPFAPSACPPLFRTGKLANGTPERPAYTRLKPRTASCSRTGPEPAQA